MKNKTKCSIKRGNFKVFLSICIVPLDTLRVAYKAHSMNRVGYQAGPKMRCLTFRKCLLSTLGDQSKYYELF